MAECNIVHALSCTQWKYLRSVGGATSLLDFGAENI
jgi:hypothetical protein